MSKLYKIEIVELYQYLAKLHEAKIDTTDDFLNICGHKQERDELAGKLGIDTDILLDWTYTADLLRIRGIGRQTSQMLKALGVKTVQDLRDQDPLGLFDRLGEINVRKKYSRINPSPYVICHWIEQAKKLDQLFFC